MIKLTLPFPPSTNTYWRRNGNRYFIAKRGVGFRENVRAVVLPMRLARFTGDVELCVDLYPPTKRRYDVDNFGGKALLDALMHAGLYDDDSQIVSLSIVRREIVKGGKCVVSLETVAPTGGVT